MANPGRPRPYHQPDRLPDVAIPGLLLAALAKSTGSSAFTMNHE
jgi:hypothetical protein